MKEISQIFKNIRGFSMSENESLSISEVVLQAMLIIWYVTQEGKLIPELKIPVITRALHTLDKN